MSKSALPKHLLFVLVAILSTASITANAQAATWTKVPIPTNASLETVNMISTVDGWAAGFDGALIHWDGKSWNDVTSPTKATLKCLDMVNSAEGYAVASGV